MEKVAKNLRYNGEYYTFSHAKRNILIYVSQPYYKYEDWYCDGGILVVLYRPEYNGKHKYVVLHQMDVSVRNGNISHRDISKLDKIPEICEN